MPSTPVDDRFSRQVILPGIGAEGQKKWSQASVLLAGEGEALSAAATALSAVGISKLQILTPVPFDGSHLTTNSGLAVEILPQSAEGNPASIAVVLSEDPAWRRGLNRRFRNQAQPVVFGWPSAGGYALFLTRYAGRDCPCLECFETMNPKAFTTGTPPIRRQLGALAASEALLWIAQGRSPIENQVWITSMETGSSLRHPVSVSGKCPARSAGGTAS